MNNIWALSPDGKNKQRLSKSFHCFENLFLHAFFLSFMSLPKHYYIHSCFEVSCDTGANHTSGEPLWLSLGGTDCACYIGICFMRYFLHLAVASLLFTNQEFKMLLMTGFYRSNLHFRNLGFAENVVIYIQRVILDLESSGSGLSDL